MSKEIFPIRSELISDTASIDRLGRAFFGPSDALSAWLYEYSIDWSYIDDSGYFIDSTGTPIEYREITHIIIDDPEAAIFFKLSWS